MWTLFLAGMLTWAADKAVYPPQKIRARGVERIEIIGVRGTLQLSGNKQRQFSLKVKHSKKRSDDWSLLVERRGKTLFLEVSNAAYGRDWNKQIKREEWPEFDIALSGPPVPTIVSWREGDLSYNGWTADLDTSFLNGPVTIRNGAGKYVLQAVNSSLLVDGFSGEMILKGEGGSVTLSRVKGSLSLNWLTGKLSTSNVNAKVKIEAQDLKAHFANSKGDWDVKLDSGSASLKNLSGRFKGQGESTSWRLDGGARSELELLSRSGSVELNWKAPARVFLTSDSGTIRSPYATEDRDGTRVSEGKNGKIPLGQVFVRTGSGAIVFTH